MKTFKEARKETKPVEAKYMTWNNKLALANINN